jgi:nitrogen regulatory protein PII
VEDEEVERIVSAIQKAAFTGKIGDGKIFVHPVDNAVRLGTAERGDAAIR